MNDISLVIATYNWPRALELCLISVLGQSVLPDEILIADDGSREETKMVIEAYQAKFDIPLRHIWQEDKGFRLAQIRNKANAAALGAYLIQIDGDLILHPDFISDHLDARLKGYYVGGSRVLLDAKKSGEHLAALNAQISFFDAGIANRMNGWHFPMLSKLISPLSNSHKLRNIRGCNMAYWREDFIAVNGYDERFEGWGKEDSDLVIRFIKMGLKRRFFKWAGIVYHLFHNEADRTSLGNNEARLKEIAHSDKYRCDKGIDQYL
ncbi:MAG: glycosyltransferase family 2 protein [Saprospiraceae bacterium]